VSKKNISYQCKNERRKGLKFNSIQLSLAGLRATTGGSVSGISSAVEWVFKE
jgi:hypothetical protein